MNDPLNWVLPTKCCFLRTILTQLTQLLKSSQTMTETPVRSGLDGGQVHER